MRKELPTPVIAGLIVLVLIIAGICLMHFTTPATVIVPKGKMPPPPNYNDMPAQARTTN